MIYAPHILQKKVLSAPIRDEFGRIRSNMTERWVDVCKCRCDNNDTTSFTSDNGSVYTPKYHIACDGHIDIPAGTFVRCLSSGGNIVICEGMVYRSKKLNHLFYSEVWI